jgi:putative hemolysin
MTEGNGRLIVGLASTQEEVREAQRLRYQVFAEEMGAKLEGGPGIDEDGYDRYADHLMVRNAATGEVVACTRLITDSRAAAGIGFYSQSEFDLTRVLVRPGRLLEVGRTCVRQGYRSGASIAVLWSGLAKVVASRGIDVLIGCASVPMLDGGLQAEAIMRTVRAKHYAPELIRVHPRKPMPRVGGAVPERPEVPPLLKAYLRLGSLVGGEPCWDEDFAVADLFIYLDVRRLDERYARHFLGVAVPDAA